MRFCFARLRCKKPRTRPKNPTIRPVLFAEENFASARIAVKPTRDQPQMLAQIAAGCCAFGFELFAKDVLRRTRLAGYLREAHEKQLREPSTMDAKNADGLFFRGALQNHGVQILDAPREFRLPAQDFVEFLDFFVERGRAFEIQLLAGFLTLFLDRGTERASAGFKELHQAPHFHVVFFLSAAREAGREAHSHFGVEAAGESGISADFNLATAHFEQSENAFGESFGGTPL